MSKFSYRFDGSSFTGQRYTYAGPSSAPCRKVLGPSSAIMIRKDDGWELSGNNSYLYGNSRGYITGGIVYESYDYLYSNIIEYIIISTTGNSSDFGDLLRRTFSLRMCSSKTRGIISGGGQGGQIPPCPELPSSCPAFKYIDYIEFSSNSNATSFGDMISSRDSHASCANDIYGLFAGGSISQNSSIPINSIENVTISTTGNSDEFGNLSSAIISLSACSSYIAGYFFGGDTSPYTDYNTIDYISISSGGSASIFGELNCDWRRATAACASSTRGIIGGGLGQNLVTPPYPDVIFYIELTASGISHNFGNLSLCRVSPSACSSKVRGCFNGGDDCNFDNIKSIDYVTIATTGNASDFGDLLYPYMRGGAASNCHGGLA